MTTLSIKELEKELKNFQDKKAALIECYKALPSDNLQNRIIDLGKTIGTIKYEINTKKLFS